MLHVALRPRWRLVAAPFASRSWQRRQLEFLRMFHTSSVHFNQRSAEARLRIPLLQIAQRKVDANLVSTVKSLQRHLFSDAHLSEPKYATHCTGCGEYYEYIEEVDGPYRSCGIAAEPLAYY